MEVIATAAETERIAATAADGLKVSFVPAERSVRMFDRLAAPFANEQAWKTSGALEVPPGGGAMFQVMVWAADRELRDVQVAGQEVTCLTTHGVDWLGKTYQRRVDVAKRQVQPLWCYVEVPRDASLGKQQRLLTVTADDVAPQTIALTLNVTDQPTASDADPQAMTRLRWLNSTTAVDREPSVGYAPLVVQDRVIRCLGREVELGDDGLPQRVTSFFTPSVTRIADDAQLQLLSAPLRMIVTTDRGEVALAGTDFAWKERSPGRVSWTATWRGAGLTATLHGAMEFDGSLQYRVALSADAPVSLADLRLEIPRAAESAELVLGLQHTTGKIPPAWDWNWDVGAKNQDSVWLGSVNGGLRVQLRAENYVRPGVNIHYKRRPLNDPPSWSGGGVGGMRWKDSVLTCFSGPRTLAAGQALHFDFNLLVTPFHPLRTAEQWRDRYYHTHGVPANYEAYLDNAAKAGATIINVHQGNWLNPYINYPFLTWEKLRDFSRAAHQRNLRVKYYYTVRELSNWATEIFAFRSMGDDLLLSGQGGGHPWGEEHLGGDYWQAWYEARVQDVSLLTQPMCRLHNYYIEGLKWLCENAECDGIYLDDIAYDRDIMLRARKVLDRNAPRGGLIDLHSWNEFNAHAGYAHCANVFMDSLPFVDRLWFGESHHYSGPPAEHFLVELSGIPFGLMGEMLEGGGNPWFGLVHGATNRLGWQGEPRPIWKLWDEFGVQADDCEFIGWWAGDACPVQTDAADVKATVWKRGDATLLAIANFSNQVRVANLKIDWSALGREPQKAKLYAPAIPELQQIEALVDPHKPIALRRFGGAVFILDEQPRQIAPPPVVSERILWEEKFAQWPADGWTLQASEQLAANAVRADSGLVLVAPANVHAFVERDLPPKATGVTARIWQDPNDEGQQWGPGIALVWPDGATLKANLRQDGRLCVSERGREHFPLAITNRAPVELRFTWNEQWLQIEAGGPALGDLTDVLARYPRTSFQGPPTQIRAGKMSADAGKKDFPHQGPAGFNRIEWLKVFE